MPKTAIIGGGPAGLRVAQILAEQGQEVVVYEKMRSVGRKFLVAGKSGLNLTNAVGREEFLSRYQGFPIDLLAKVYDGFGNDDLRQWARELGQDTFESSGRKVFPASMKAAPLLRAWVQNIKGNGGQFFVNHSLMNFKEVGGSYELLFQTPEGTVVKNFDRIVLALGGGSWAKTGSDGRWVSFLSDQGVTVNPLASANCGWQIDWDDEFLNVAEGKPWKNIICSVGEDSLQGELVVTKYGLEGGPIYRLGYALRQMDKPELIIDFKSSFTVTQLEKKAESVRKNLGSELKQRWKISEGIIAYLESQYKEIFGKNKVSMSDISTLAEAVKCTEIPLIGPRPIDEAISSAGGIDWNELDERLMIKKLPNVYACGEMLDWEASTGGFLLQGCFASATWLAKHL